MVEAVIANSSFLGIHFLDPLEKLGEAFVKDYNYGLVFLSLLVSSLAAYTAITISLIIRDQKSQVAKYSWLVTGAISMGCGIWAMHFIGMLSLRLPIDVEYSMAITLASVVPAILAAAVSLYLASFIPPTRMSVICGGLLMGVGIAAMHYTGMKGMVMNGVMRYDPLVTSLSLIVAVLFATISMRTLSHYQGQRTRAKMSASLVMGLAVFGMHFISMVGVYFFAFDKGILVDASSSAYLATGISIVTIATLSLSIIAALVEHLLAKARTYSATLEKDVEERTAQLAAEIEERAKTQDALEETLSALNAAQGDLIESEKMASLGGLVAGISHEINTPIGIAVTAASHLNDHTRQLEKGFKEGTATKTDLSDFLGVAQQSSDMLMSNLQRAADLISSFKRVAVDMSSDDVMEVNIADYMQEVLASLHPEMKKSAPIVEVVCPSDLMTTTNPGAISQVMTNLIMNSLIHGFEGKQGGTIKMEVISNGDMIEFAYSDDGAGMESHVVEKIFEPFFTTKRGSGGSGLGMHILYNLITQSLKGSVTCKSKPGEGTQFAISFPRELVHG